MNTTKKVLKNNFRIRNITTFTVICSLMRKIKVGTNKITNNYLDTDTGEILEVEQEVKHQSIIVESPEHFAMINIPVIGMIDNLDNTSIKVLIWCALNADYNKNTVNLTKPMCTLITKDYKISYQTIKNAISKLAKKKALIPLGSGTYRVNPRYFWKGQSNVKRRTMKYILEVECPTANN